MNLFKLKKIFIKITDKYIYIYNNKLIIKKSLYIKNGKVTNVESLVTYLNKIIYNKYINIKYYFILDTLLTYSDIYVYKVVFDKLNIINYEIVNDTYFINNIINDNNIIIFNWSSSINYCYLINNNLITKKYSLKAINNLSKKYIILMGDTKINRDFNKPIYTFENNDFILFKGIKES